MAIVASLIGLSEANNAQYRSATVRSVSLGGVGGPDFH